MDYQDNIKTDILYKQLGGNVSRGAYENIEVVVSVCIACCPSLDNTFETFLHFTVTHLPQPWLLLNFPLFYLLRGLITSMCVCVCVCGPFYIILWCEHCRTNRSCAYHHRVPGNLIFRYSLIASSEVM